MNRFRPCILSSVKCRERRRYYVHKVSEFFPPSSNTKVHAHNKCTELMFMSGLIRPSSPGIYHLMPLAMRSLNKLIRLVDQAMEEIGAQRIEMPNLLAESLWRKTGRWQSMGSELYRLQDRENKNFCLAPTHEEAIAHLVASVGQISSKRLPIKLYQISTKFRDEMRTKHGLLRGKQFLMKDLYTFDESEDSAMKTYDLVNEVYWKLFVSLGFNVAKVVGENSVMGGSISHEYHVLNPVGEDQLAICPQGDFSVNLNVLGNTDLICPNCKNPIEVKQGIEIGHTFYLGTRYTEPFEVYCTDDDKTLMHMASYGIGLTRILATCVEVFSQDDEIRWPEAIAPFRMCFIMPKKGGKSETAVHLGDRIFQELQKFSIWHNDVVVDDRVQHSVGKRLIHAQKLGFPFILVVGKEAADENPKLWLHHLTTGTVVSLSPDEVIPFVNEAAKNHKNQLNKMTNNDIVENLKN